MGNLMRRFYEEPSVRTKETLPSGLPEFSCDTTEENQKLLMSYGYYRYQWGSESATRSKPRRTAYSVVCLKKDGRITYSDMKKTLHISNVELPEFLRKEWLLRNAMPLTPTGNPHTKEIPCVSTGGNQKQQETQMSNVLSQYTQVNFATPILFRGQDIKDLDKPKYLSLIRQLNEEIESYKDIKGSNAVNNITNSLTNDRDRLTKYFDEHMESKEK